MKGTRLIDLTRGICALLFVPAAALAQVPATPMSPPGAATPAAEGGGATAGAAIAIGLVLLAIVIGLVKLYDAKRKRDDAAMALGARLSDVLLVEPSLRGFPVVATVQMPLSQRSDAIVELRGTVATNALRDTALEVVARTLRTEGVTARLEDHLAVDPRSLERVA